MVAETSGNPYLGIAGSNVFRLKPPERQVTAPPPAPLAEVKLVGVTTMSDKRALLKVHLPARPPEPAKEFACILMVGQREGPIEVMKIDEAAGSVTVKNSGTVMVLTFEQDSPHPQNPPPEPPPLPIQSASRR